MPHTSRIPSNCLYILLSIVIHCLVRDNHGETISMASVAKKKIITTTTIANCYTLNANRSARRSVKIPRRTIPAMDSARACRIKSEQISATSTYHCHTKTTLDFSHRYTPWPPTTCSYLDHLNLSLSPPTVSLCLLPGYVTW